MSTLTKAQGAQIRSLMKEDRWSAVQAALAKKVDQWREQQISGETAYQELKAFHLREGKIAGVIELFDEMERSAFSD